MSFSSHGCAARTDELFSFIKEVLAGRWRGDDEEELAELRTRCVVMHGASQLFSTAVY
jgi:hypothetical protein